jgi:hypothetical protein
VSKPEKRKQLLASLFDKHVVSQWIKMHESLEIGEMTLSRLQLEAQRRCITSVKQLQRDELIREILAHDEQVKEFGAITKGPQLEQEIRQLIKILSIFNFNTKTLELNLDSIPYYPEQMFDDCSEWLDRLKRIATTIKRIFESQEKSLWIRYVTWQGFENNREMTAINDCLVKLGRLLREPTRPFIFQRRLKWTRQEDSSVTKKKLSSVQRKKKEHYQSLKGKKLDRRLTSSQKEYMHSNKPQSQTDGQ